MADTLANASWAAMWGLISAISLVLGSAIGIVKRPGRSFGASILAFGGGALLEALSIELFGHILHLQADHGLEVVLVAVAAAVGGGCFFSALGKYLNSAGGFMKNRGSMREALRSMRAKWRRRLVQRLQLVPMFHALKEADLIQLAGRMQRSSYRRDQPIYSAAEDGKGQAPPLLFILQGSVRVTLYGFGTLQPNAPKAELAAVVAPHSVAVTTKQGEGSHRTSLKGATSPRPKLNSTKPSSPEVSLNGHATENAAAPAETVEDLDHAALPPASPYVPSPASPPAPSTPLSLVACEGEYEPACTRTSVASTTSVASHIASVVGEGLPPHESFECTRDVTFGDVALLTGLPALSEAIALGDEKGGRTRVLRIERHDLDRWLMVNPRAAAALTDHLRRLSAPCNSARSSTAWTADNYPRSRSPSVLASLSGVARVGPHARRKSGATPDGADERRARRHTKEGGADGNSFSKPDGDSFSKSQSADSPVVSLKDGGMIAEGVPIKNVDGEKACRGSGRRGSTPTMLLSEALASNSPAASPTEPKTRRSSARRLSKEGSPWLSRLNRLSRDPEEADEPVDDALARCRSGYPTLADYGWRRSKSHSGARLSNGTLKKMVNIASAASRISGAAADRAMNPHKKKKGQEAEDGAFDRQKLLGLLEHRDDSLTMDIDQTDDISHEMKLMEEHLTSNHPSDNRKAAIMIWLGILIDAVPESFTLGILANSGDTPSLVTFTVGVFIANFPEALSSSAIMHACGIKRARVLLMWAVIWLGTGVGAALGAIAFPPLDGDEPSRARVLSVAAIEGMCGGAMLTMIASSVLPEAFEQSHDVAGLSCTLGFLTAMLVKAVSTEMQRGDSSSSGSG